MKNVSCKVKSAIKNIDCINGGQTEKRDIKTTWVRKRPSELW